MKILDIRFKNLNSLKGEWHINLTDNAYAANGIFLITGPTGSGKTTIFDAICLALYGQTPRLPKINSKHNEIMTRKTHECFAKVEFESGEKKYIAYWQHNSKGIKHEISYADTGEILSTINVKEITGLDFQRFKQAVMLEQGGFDSFLKAKASERSQILELLTGSEIYGRISTLIYERNDREKNELQRILDTIKIKQPNDGFENENELQTALKENNEKLKILNEDYTKTKSGLDWREAIAKIENERLQNQDDIIQFEKELDNFVPEKRKLDLASRAVSLEGKYAELVEKRKNSASLENTCNKLKNQISIDEFEQAKFNEILPKLEREATELRNGLEENESPDAVHEKVKNLTVTIEKHRKDFANLKAEISNLYEQLSDLDKDLNKAKKEYTESLEKYKVAFDHLYESERQKLKEGKPCPICGSTHHPYAAKESDRKIIFPNLDEARKNYDDATQKLHNLRNEQTRISTDLESKKKNLDEVKEAGCNTRAEIEKITVPLGIDYKKIDEWLNKIKSCDEKIQKTSKSLDTLKARLENNKNLFSDENNKLEVAANELEILENNFKAELSEKNFANENEFLASRMEPKLLDKLQNRERELNDKQTRLHAICENINERLEKKLSEAITKFTLEELKPKFENLENDIKSLQKNIFVLEKNLNDRKKLKSELEELNQKFETQKKICEDWAEFNKYLGQKDGGSYRAFAQKITLEMLSEFANIQLKKMSGRYSLIARPGDKDKELNLSVIDNEQGGETRPTENLSGGERFIISLALALSLSQISGNKSQIDSLFLDEGFGSLDEEALSTALEALGEIQRKGKIIGIISHVNALKERITTQINVIPKSEGTSILDGVGIEKRGAGEQI